MRQRRVKNEAERVLHYEPYIVLNAENSNGKWHSYFNNNNPIHMEIGCGRGQFVASLAEKNPKTNYIAVEPIGSVLLRALEKIDSKQLKNVLFLWKYADHIETYLGENEIDKIYLNFSDPWPKERHAKRRLLHRNFINQYKKIMKKGGEIEFKTDNLNLFNFSLEEFQTCGMKLIESTNDLYQSPYISENTPTEYEEKFISLEMKINYCKVINTK